MIRRGEIYYVESGSTVGYEIAKNRPGVIISANELNELTGTVTVALLSESEQTVAEPYVARISATGVPSTAICAKITTVDMSRLGTYMGTCTAQEMRAVEKAVLASLALPDKLPEAEITAVTPQSASVDGSLWEAQRATYREFIGELLDRLVGKRD